jgi:transposase
MVYIESDREQIQLLPTNLRDIISKGHICYLIEEVVHELDFCTFDEKVQGPGNPSYHPRILLKIVINGICERITSTRKLAKLTSENIIFKYLAENLTPDFHTIALFRQNNSSLIKECFLQTIEIAKELDMVNLNKLYLDGTKIKANASKSNSFTKDELVFLSDFVDKQMKKMDDCDEEENKKYGDSEGEPKIPDNFTNRSNLRKKIKEILNKPGKYKNKIDNARGSFTEKNIKEINLTDPDSQLMKMKQGAGFKQAYNCQFLVEDKGEIIVGNYLSDNPADVSETEPTMEKFKQEQKIGLVNVEVFQDNGYSRSSTAEYYEKEGAIAYIPDAATTKELHGKAKDILKYDIDNFKFDFKRNQATCPDGHIMNFVRKDFNNKDKTNWTNIYRTDKCKTCPNKNECITNKKDLKRGYREAKINPSMRKIRLRFKTQEGMEKYNKRFHKGEIAQAHILYNLGYREFKTRSKKSCENEVNLFSTAYNLKKIYNKIKDNIKKINETIKKVPFIFGLSYFSMEL